jgi:hypothetical protein
MVQVEHTQWRATVQCFPHRQLGILSRAILSSGKASLTSLMYVDDYVELLDVMDQDQYSRSVKYDVQ